MRLQSSYRKTHRFGVLNSLGAGQDQLRFHAVDGRQVDARLPRGDTHVQKPIAVSEICWESLPDLAARFVSRHNNFGCSASRCNLIEQSCASVGKENPFRR